MLMIMLTSSYNYIQNCMILQKHRNNFIHDFPEYHVILIQIEKDKHSHERGCMTIPIWWLCQWMLTSLKAH